MFFYTLFEMIEIIHYFLLEKLTIKSKNRYLG